MSEHDSVYPTSVPPAPPGYRSTRCVRCNAVQNVELSQNGFSCWQCKLLNFVQPPSQASTEKPEQDMREWLSDARQADPKPKWSNKKKILVAGAVALAVPILGSMYYSQYMDEKTVSERHSDNPTVQAFYDELVVKGFGNMRSGDAVKWAHAYCDGSATPWVIWGERDKFGNSYGPLDTGKFTSAATKLCGDPEK